MCHLLADPSIEVQKMAYQLLHASARKRTEDLVIEAGVSIEAPTKSELPLELVDFLQQNVDFEEEVGSHVSHRSMLEPTAFLICEIRLPSVICWGG